jgi:hypothetical protein
MNRVASLNDAFRKTCSGGTIMMKDSVQALPDMVRADALVRVATFDDFNADNDPHEEHDFGSFELCGRRFFWKIDYYDKDLAFARLCDSPIATATSSPDPTDSSSN